MKEREVEMSQYAIKLNCAARCYRPSALMAPLAMAYHRSGSSPKPTIGDAAIHKALISSSVVNAAKKCSLTIMNVTKDPIIMNTDAVFILR